MSINLGKDEYKLILLDTNAIREVITNTNLSGKGFFEKFFINNVKYISCFSIYNLIEIMPYADIFEKFIKFFSTIPCLMFYPIKLAIDQEYHQYCLGKKLIIDNQVAQVFIPVIGNDMYNFKKFANGMKKDEKFINTIKKDIEQLKDIAKDWEEQRNSKGKLLKGMEMPNDFIDEKFYFDQEYETITKDIQNWEITIGSKKIDIKEFPILRIMAYSQFNRVHLTKKEIKPNDVMDIRIGGIVPYVDAVVTENHQADIYRKAKKYILQMNQVEIYTLRDIRLEQV